MKMKSRNLNKLVVAVWSIKAYFYLLLKGVEFSVLNVLFKVSNDKFPAFCLRLSVCVPQVLLGWKYGDCVDEKAKIHPQLRAYKSLTEKVRMFSL